MQSCGTCAYSWSRLADTLVSCGAPDEPPGANPQRLSRDDGRECRMWQAKDDPACSGQAAQCWFRL
jgi:hypothetical protein